MSGETEKDISGWTTDTLHQHVMAEIRGLDRFVNQRIDAQADKVVLALTAAERAVTKAETATEKRFEGVNEFRQTLSDQAATFVSRVEYNAMRDAIVEKMQGLIGRVDKAEAKNQGIGAVWGWAVGAAGAAAAIAAVATIFMR